MALALYAHPLSHYCQKAIIALYELNLPFELKFLDHTKPDSYTEFLQAWPFGKFPVLRDGETIVPEATLVIEYANNLAGENRLIPHGAEAAREARLLDRIFDNYVATPQQKIIGDTMRAETDRDPKGVEDAHALLEKSYDWLNTRLAGRLWAAGETFSLADCGAAPMLFYADWFHPIAATYPVLKDYTARLRTRPSVARTFTEARPFYGLVPGGIPPHVAALIQ